MVARVTPKPATYADVLAAPRHMVAEVLFGALHTHPRPAGPHSAASSVIGVELGGPFMRGKGGPGGWILLDEPELHLGEDIVVPDVAGWRRERMPKVPAAAYFTLVPDWACEVLSPGTRKLDQTDKLTIYAREGVRHVWHVDPDARTLLDMRLERERYSILATHRDDDRVRAEPFEAIELELAALWADVEG